MPSCCGGSTCNCVITAGAGVTIVGAGTTSSPYVVSGTGGVDLGNRSGGVSLSTTVGLYTMEATGTVTLSAGGPYGEILVKIDGDHTVNLAGITWATTPLDAPGTMMIIHWPDGNWFAYALLTGETEGGGGDDGDWEDIVLDTFTGATADITSHAPDTTPGPGPWRNGAAWQEPAGSTTDQWRIDTNKLTMDAGASSATTFYNALPLGTVTKTGIGCKVDYSLVNQGDSSAPDFTLDCGVGFGMKITKVSGTATITANNGGGHGAVTLTGTTTGLPLSGTIGFRIVGTALTVIADGVSIATGTTFDDHSTSAWVGINLTSFNTSTLDNYKVEKLP